MGIGIPGDTMILVQERFGDQDARANSGSGAVPLCPMGRVELPWKGSPYGKHLYDLVKGWEAQSPLEEGEQGMMDWQHFQPQFKTRLRWRWDTGAAVGLRVSSGVGEHGAGSRIPGTLAPCVGAVLVGLVLTGCSPCSTHPHPPNPSTVKALPSLELPTLLKALSSSCCCPSMDELALGGSRDGAGIPRPPALALPSLGCIPWISAGLRVNRTLYPRFPFQYHIPFYHCCSPFLAAFTLPSPLSLLLWHFHSTGSI